MKNKETFKKIVLVPLPYFSSTDLKRYAQFESGIKLTKTSENFLDYLPKNIRDPFWEQLSKVEKDLVKGSIFWLKHEYYDESLNFNSSIDGFEDEKISVFLLCVWLMKPLSVSGELRFRFCKDEENVCSFSRRFAKIYTHKEEDLELFSYKDVKKLKKLWISMHTYLHFDPQKKRKAKRLFDALSKVYDGVYAYHYDSRFVFFTIALESLFLLERHELNYRLCNRISWFLGFNRSERKEIFNGTNDIYKARSGFVHGILPTKPLKEKDMNLLRSLEKLCRDIMLKIFTTPNLLKIFTSGDNAIREYLDSLTLGAK